MPTILVVQSNRALCAFSTRSRVQISVRDTARADQIVAGISAAESGYYDVLLLPGRVSAAAYSDLALQVPSHVYTMARDHVIGLK
jgi:hypothetical protein